MPSCPFSSLSLPMYSNSSATSLFLWHTLIFISLLRKFSAILMSEIGFQGAGAQGTWQRHRKGQKRSLWDPFGSNDVLVWLDSQMLLFVLTLQFNYLCSFLLCTDKNGVFEMWIELVNVVTFFPPSLWTNLFNSFLIQNVCYYMTGVWINSKLIAGLRCKSTDNILLQGQRISEVLAVLYLRGSPEEAEGRASRLTSNPFPPCPHV